MRLLALPITVGILFAAQTKNYDADLPQSAIAAMEARFGKYYWASAPTKRFGLAWTKTSTRSRKQYAQIQQQVDINFIRAADSPQEYIYDLRNKAIERPKDPECLFAWGYAAMKYSAELNELGNSYWNSYARLREHDTLAWWLADAPDPLATEYTRLRFLVEAREDRSDLIPLGERLHRINPSDDRVTRCLARLYAGTKNSADSLRAITMAETLLKAQPNRLPNVHLMFSIYFARWSDLGKQRADAIEGTRWARKYLSVAPANATWRFTISRLASKLAERN